MSKRLLNIAGCAALVAALSAVCLAQTPQNQQPTTQTTTTTTTQTTQAVQNADGTWTVVEYPAQKEVTVDFLPGPTFSTAKGRAKILRANDGTTVTLDLSGLPANTTSLNVYAVDPMGKLTSLGPLPITNGAGVHTVVTPLDKFMLVLSPEQNLTSFGPDANVAFRSAVPQGLAVLPLAHRDREDGAAVGERVAATTVTSVPAYSAPMLNVPGMKRGEDTQVKVNLTGELTGARVNFNIEPRKDGPTMITARFHEMKEAPAGKVYTLWAVSPDNKFVKLGQVVNTGTRNEAEIKSETTLQDFGLLITLEDETIPAPRGTVVGTIMP
ncbi:MAG TPA: hypothetical protein VD968_11845 [Pyrinomonadaceae bacterium]|nr:hypothetical protein [Pyrinomonadaceae bacterium]